MQISFKTSLALTLLVIIGSLLPVASLMAEGVPAITYLPRMEVDKPNAKLGKRLFFDKRLSGSEQIACATCHQPKLGYSSNQRLSPGNLAGGGFRNVPGLINTAHKTSWGWDGRHHQLSAMIGEMFRDPYTMNMDTLLLEERMRQDEVYVDLFAAAGKSQVSSDGAYTAIAEYLKRLTSKNVPLDIGTFSESASRGKILFEGKAGCNRCHYGAMLSDGKSHNLGVPVNPEIFKVAENYQVFLTYAKQRMSKPMSLEDDPGRYGITKAPQDQGAFMTPGLRELSVTGPYMHNGSLKTLADVVEFYFFGGGSHGGKSRLLQSLDINFAEMNDLIAFLESLSGRELSSARYVWSKPYEEEYSPIRYWSGSR